MAITGCQLYTAQTAQVPTDNLKRLNALLYTTRDLLNELRTKAHSIITAQEFLQRLDEEQAAHEEQNEETDEEQDEEQQAGGGAAAGPARAQPQRQIPERDKAILNSLLERAKNIIDRTNTYAQQHLSNTVVDQVSIQRHCHNVQLNANGRNNAQPQAQQNAQQPRTQPRTGTARQQQQQRNAQPRPQQQNAQPQQSQGNNLNLRQIDVNNIESIQNISTIINNAMPHLELAIEEIESLLPDQFVEFLKNHWGKLGTLGLLGANGLSEGKSSIIGSIYESFKNKKITDSYKLVSTDHAILGLLIGAIYTAYTYREFIQDQLGTVKGVITTTRDGINSIYGTLYDLWQDKKSLAKAAGVIAALAVWNYYARGDKSIPGHIMEHGFEGIAPCVFDQGRAIVMAGVHGIRSLGGNGQAIVQQPAAIAQQQPKGGIFSSLDALCQQFLSQSFYYVN